MMIMMLKILIIKSKRVATLRFFFLFLLLASFAAHTPIAPVPLQDGLGIHLSNTLTAALAQDFPRGKALLCLCLLVLWLARLQMTNTLVWITLLPFPLALILLIFSHYYAWLDPFVAWCALTPFIMYAVLVARCLLVKLAYKARGRPQPTFSHFPFGNAYWLLIPTATAGEPGFDSSDSFTHHHHSHSDTDSYCSNDSTDSCSDSGSDSGGSD